MLTSVRTKRSITRAARAAIRELLDDIKEERDQEYANHEQLQDFVAHGLPGEWERPEVLGELKHDTEELHAHALRAAEFTSADIIEAL